MELEEHCDELPARFLLFPMLLESLEVSPSESGLVAAARSKKVGPWMADGIAAMG